MHLLINSPKLLPTEIVGEGSGFAEWENMQKIEKKNSINVFFFPIDNQVVVKSFK